MRLLTRVSQSSNETAGAFDSGLDMETSLNHADSTRGPNTNSARR
jgi:hypothetical protein